MRKKQMVVLHICDIDNDKCSGVSAVVPECYHHQKKYCNAGLLCCSSVVIDNLKDEDGVFYYSEFSSINNLPNPYNKPDLVVFHEIYKPKYMLLYRECKRNDIHYIIIPHGCLTKWAQHHKWLKKKIGNFLFFKKFIKSAKCIQYLSENESLNSIGYNKHFFVQGNGIHNIPADNQYLKKRHNGLGLRFIYVGRFDYYIKGLDRLLKACCILRDELIEQGITLNLYGKGDDRRLKKTINDLGLSSIVYIHGPIFGDEKRKALINNDVFIQVSRTEGQPLGVLEALSLGLPVCLSDGVGMNEDITNNGVGFNAGGDETQVAEAIKTIISSKDKLHIYSNNAYRFASKKYDWNLIAKDTIALYSSVINGSLHGGGIKP